MMTYAWTLGWTLLNESRKYEMSSITEEYIMLLLKLITSEQQLYAEKAWADPIVIVQ